nr:Rgg/GadR/MutR family transcriptional regulator [Carnobacterium maltaromaticum]
MNYGAKIREIRINKGYTQKKIYSDIMSKSYTIEFEKGKHSISTNRLIKILDRLSMDVDEFLFINKGYLLNDYSEYIYKLSNYSNVHDLKGLKEMLEENSKKSTPISLVRFAEIRCRINAIEKFNETGIFDGSATLEEDRRTIQEYLVQIETWTLREIQLFGNTVEFLDFDKHFVLFKNLSKSLSLYIEYDKGREIFCTMLVNLISQAIKSDYLDYGEVLIYQLKILSSDYKFFFHKTVAKYFENVLLIKRGTHIEDSYKECHLILELLLDLDYSSIANELKMVLTSKNK